MKYKNIYERILTSAKSRLGLDLPIVSRTVLDRPVKVRIDTIADKPDMDDGWLYALITECSVFYDVGSNIGEASLWACLDDPYRRVVVMEANSRALAVAQKNFDLNGFSTRVRCVLAFISDTEDEDVAFFAEGVKQASSRYSSHTSSFKNSKSTIKVKTTTLDRVARETGFVPDLIKIDVEGAEAEALAGAREVARQHQPRFIVEMHSMPELSMRENGEKVLAWCQELGYDCYYLKTHEQVTSPDGFAERKRCHLYLQPAGQPYPAYLKEIGQGSMLDEARAIMRRHNSR